ncbi:MAG TPA: aminotransferase class I/II-fold pyridoxal phosphate-dependent enzyme [Longimicrobiales bacterium]|nr:aminotransferase class I/II-fold pyridoxal phosphate-dependent enzyme [Longimicrobiales bacterium]
MPRVHRRFEDFPAYPLAEVPRIRRELRAQGVDVIDLGAGDADLAPPPRAVAALRAAAEEVGMSRYGFQLGLVELRESIAAWMRGRFGVSLDAMREVLPLLGSKEGIAHLAFGYVGPGDATVIPDPGYQPYRGGTLLAGGTPHLVPLRPENDFLVPFGEIPAAVAERTRIVYLNYPNNPTAAAAPTGYLEEAVTWCRQHDAILCYDNAYSEIAFDGYRPPSILELDGARDVAIEFHSFSKTYNMTGWRIGWAAGKAEIIAALQRVKTFTDTGPFLAVQAGARAALESYDEWVPGNVETFRRRRDAAASSLTRAGFAVEVPTATIYLWVPVPGGEPSEAFALRALQDEGVVVMPGAAMGAGGEGFFRVALTAAEGRLEEAAERLGRVI